MVQAFCNTSIDFHIEKTGKMLVMITRIINILTFWTPSLQPEGSYKIGSVHSSVLQSFCPSFCQGVFLELHHQFFLNFDMILETHMQLCMTEPNFLENFFLPQTLFCGIPQFNGLKMDKNQVFLNLLKDFGSNFL